MFYDPKAPTIAYLETRRSGGAVFLLLFGGLFAVMGLGALVLVALVACSRRFARSRAGAVVERPS